MAKNDIQLEDVEDYTSDFPPEYPEGVEVEKTRRVGFCRGLILANKKMTALLVLVFALVIAIVSILVTGKDELASDGFHQPLILIDPSTLDAKVTGPLMDQLLAMYDRRDMDASQLDPSAGDDTPQRRAFFWLAHDNQKLDHTTKMYRYALAVFYYSTNQVKTEQDDEPKTWFLARRWLTKANYCEWHGIICDARQRVTAIDLEQNSLSGYLPLEMQIMEETLESLSLASNGLSMDDDDFDVFNNLVNLEELIADDNYLEYHSGLPPQMASLTNLRKLTLSFNLLEGELEADPNNLVIQAMPKLSHLEMESNYFSGSMPGHIGRMDGLTYLYMRNNNLEKNLNFLHAGAMTSLFAMWLDGNAITGTLPTQLGQMARLASLSIAKTKVSGTIPKELGNATGLRRIWMYSNELTGSIPEEITKLSKLEVFEVHKNNLVGDMPNGICTIFDSVDYDFKALTSDCKSEVNCANNCCTKCY